MPQQPFSVTRHCFKVHLYTGIVKTGGDKSITRPHVLLQRRESKFKMLSTHMKKFACWRLRSPAVAFVFDVAVTVLDRPVELACNRTNSWTNPLRSGYFAARTRVLESFEFQPEKNFPPDLPAQVLMQRMLPLRNSSVTTADVTEDWGKKNRMWQVCVSFPWSSIVF